MTDRQSTNKHIGHPPETGEYSEQGSRVMEGDVQMLGGSAGSRVLTPRSEYASYMRTDELLGLQKADAELLHRDERLFQCVHQSTELWLKQATFEIEYAIRLIDSDRLTAAAQILSRAGACLDNITRQLIVLAKISSFDFGILRPALGKGSGLESPGWHAIREIAPKLYASLTARREAQQLTLSDMFKSGSDSALYVLAEALLDIDEKISVWRVQHLNIAVRTIGNGGVGTKGMPVQTLANLLNHHLFADLWEARSATAVSYG
ncbi:MAG: tryptophan 2,3-dioxygenase [Alcaligenaceae bacterium]|nr:MAG: tryptophan 2,3-dioxygenase [Alcaligenaceae bacterium]